MAVLKADSVKKALQKKGFATATGKQKHAKYIFLDNGMQTVIITHMSHNNQEINDFLQSQMAEQLHLSKSEFLEMISCKLGHEGLVSHYTNLGFLEKE